MSRSIRDDIKDSRKRLHSEIEAAGGNTAKVITARLRNMARTGDLAVIEALSNSLAKQLSVLIFGEMSAEDRNVGICQIGGIRALWLRILESCEYVDAEYDEDELDELNPFEVVTEDEHPLELA